MKSQEKMYQTKRGCKEKEFYPIIDEMSLDLGNMYWFMKNKMVYHCSRQVVGGRMLQRC